jgi:hypothetical protein
LLFYVLRRLTYAGSTQKPGQLAEPATSSVFPKRTLVPSLTFIYIFYPWHGRWNR